MKRLHAWLFAGSLLASSAASALQPATTNIVPDTDPTLSLGTTVIPGGAVQLIDGGTRAGNNLFHSFAQFDLTRGDTARFVHTAGNEATIANVVSRVTGGAPSHIDGTIDSTALPNADFWFINPAGIMFGEGARINVPAAAHFATAEEIRFAAGPAFAVTTPGGSTFSVAAPAAFGFLGGQGNIAVENAGADFLGATGRLTLAGRDVAVSDSAIAGAALRLIGAGGGAVEVPSGDPLTATGLNGAVDIRRSTLSASNAGGEAGILIAAGEVTIDGRSSLVSESLPGSTGEPGWIALRADTIRLREGSTIASTTTSDRPSGNIEIQAGRLEITSSGTRENPVGPTGISSDSRGVGNAGAILLDVGALVMDGPVFITSDGFSIGNGGRIAIMADTVSMMSGALIASQTFGNGTGGEISIHAGSLLVGFESLIQSDTGAPGGFPDFDGGAGGSILLDVGSLVVRDTGQVRASTFTRGNAGAISVLADSVRIENSGLITSESFSGGRAGSIDIATRSLVIDGGEISTTAQGGCVLEGCDPGGDAGDIVIDAGTLTVGGRDGLSGQIASDTFTDGRAGSITIRADNVQLQPDSRIASSAQFGSSGDAGSIEIAARTLAMDIASISSSANGTGSAGRIAITADSILVDRLSAITSAAGLDAGGAGTIALSGGRIRIDHGSLVSSSTFGSGPGGGVAIVADRLEVAEFSQILSSTFGSGDGGQVKIAAGAIDLGRGADIASRAEEGSTGNAGTVRLDADNLTARDAASISSSTIGAGNAGTVIVNADSIMLDGDSRISSGSSVNATGGSGSVLISTGRLDVLGASSIETISNNARPAGSIAITADSVRVDGAASSISSANDFALAGDAGRVSIEAAALNVANGGEISTSSVAGAAGDIVVTMPTAGLLRLDGAAAPGVITTSSGPGTGGRIIIAAPRAIISNGGSILALGERGGANVQIQTMFFINSADRPNRVAVDGSFLLEAQVGDVSSGTVERDLSVIDASGVLRGQCAAVRETGRVSQLVVRPVGPYARPPLPDPPPGGTCA